MAAWADGCSQCWLLTPLSLLISFLSSILSGDLTDQHSLLRSSFLSSLFGLSSVLLQFHLLPRFFIALPSFTSSPLALLFSPASLVIGWLFMCTNPCLACIATVMSELTLPHRPPICSSAPPTSLIISTFDRLGLWAATAADYRAVGHLAHSVWLAVGRRRGKKYYIHYAHRFKLIFNFYTLNMVAVHELYLCPDS